MNGKPLEILTRLALEAEQLHGQDAALQGGDPAERCIAPGCLPFDRLHRLAVGASIATYAESRHLSACRRCSIRVQAFSEVGIWTAPRLRLRPARRWLVQVVGIAAGLSLLFIWNVRPIGPRPIHSHEPKWLRADGYAQAGGVYPWAASCIAGDADCDGFITDQDTDAFFLAVANPEQFRQVYRGCEITCGNDINGDGVVDHRDIAPFIACMFGH
jgi:hypothetical protein